MLWKMVTNNVVSGQTHADHLYDLQCVLLHVCRCCNGRYYAGWANNQFIPVPVADSKDRSL